MISRIEEKFLIANLEKFLELNKKKLKKIYKKRKIITIYYDDNFLTSYTNSIEGILPREKNRVRFYADVNNSLKSYSNLKKFEFNKLYFEKKISDYYSRKKIVTKIIDNIIPENLKSSFKTLLFPKTLVSYDREYFVFDNNENYRLTLDTNISFAKINLNFDISKFNFTNQKILELKNQKTSIHNLDIKNYLSVQTSRYSKYCSSIASVY